MILKIKDIVIFAAKFHNFCTESAKSVLAMKHPKITEIGTGNLRSDREKPGKLESSWFLQL